MRPARNRTQTGPGTTDRPARIRDTRRPVQTEAPIAAEVFNLARQEGADPARLCREAAAAAQAQRDREDSERKFQTSFDFINE